MARIRPLTRRLTVAVSVLALALAACGTDEEPAAAPIDDEPTDALPDTDDPDDEPVPDADEPLPTEDDGSGAAGGTTMRVYTLGEARAAAVEGSIHVTGLLIDAGDGWRLCEVVLESYPPQCGGDSVVVEGVDPSMFPLEEQSGVRWQTDATVVGELDGDTFTITGSAAAS